MDTHQTRERGDGKVGTLSKGLGWLSVGLGVAEMAAPAALARLIGVQPDRRTRTTLRLFGAREIAHAIGIFAKPRQPMPVWSRVLGDAIDLSFLAWAMKSKRTNTERMVGAVVAVLGVTVLDVFAGTSLQRTGRVQRPHTKKMSVTINRPLQEVSQRWREVAGDLSSKGQVTFRTAPGGRGTEVSLEIPTPGRLKMAAGRLLHNDAEQMADGDLRKVKQLIEVGEIVHSDSSIHRGMHAAQPSARKER
ncbi:MAG: hypothetical protein JWP01_171 [Myxococcales bacterium]|nr:hypothetical protein [Myxococcales bacterium]